MKTGSAGLALIESFEGLILQSYDDYNDHVVKAGDTVRGTLTIGYGHTTSAGGPRVTAGQVITKEQAVSLLQGDLSRVEADVTKLVKVPLNQNQFDALVSFQFNTGALGRSSVLRLLNAKNYKGAAQALLLYNKGNGQVLAGLVRRRKAEQDLFNKPSSVLPGTKATTAGAVIATGAAIAHNNPHHYGLIIAGVVITIGLAWLVIHYLGKK